jgi:hypothetical protein
MRSSDAGDHSVREARAISKKASTSRSWRTRLGPDVATRCVLTEPIRLIARTRSLEEALVGRRDDIGAQVCKRELTSVAPMDLSAGGSRLSSSIASTRPRSVGGTTIQDLRLAERAEQHVLESLGDLRSVEVAPGEPKRCGTPALAFLGVC